MNYIDHARQQDKLRQCFMKLESLLEERQTIFDRTQPGSGGSEVKTSPRNDKYDAYLISAEIIDSKIDDAWNMVMQWEKLLDKTETALSESHDILDKVYYRIEVRGYTIGKAAQELHYTERQVRRFMRRIGQELSGIVQ